MSIASIVPVLLITGLVQILKESLGLPSKYVQIAVFTLAVIFGVLFYISSSLTEVVVSVCGYGLMAIGLWEVGGKKYEAVRGLNNTTNPVSGQAPAQGTDSD